MKTTQLIPAAGERKTDKHRGFDGGRGGAVIA